MFFGANIVVASFAVVPGAASTMCVVAGVVHGALKGTALVVGSSSCGACVSFALARYLARPVVEQMLDREGSHKVQALDQAVARDGALIVLLTRLSPFHPFVASSFLFGLTAVPFLEYWPATIGGLMPSTFMYVYLGETGKRAATSTGRANVFELLVYGTGLAAAVAVTWRIIALANHTLALAGVGPPSASGMGGVSGAAGASERITSPAQGPSTMRRQATFPEKEVIV